MYPFHRCNLYMAGFEYILYHRIRPFSRRPLPAYPSVAQFIIDTYRMISHILFHCCIVTFGFDAKITLIPVYNLPLLREIDLAIVD